MAGKRNAPADVELELEPDPWAWPTDGVAVTYVGDEPTIGLEYRHPDGVRARIEVASGDTVVVPEELADGLLTRADFRKG